MSVPRQLPLQQRTYRTQVPLLATPEESDTESPSIPNPFTAQRVPDDQQPVNELRAIRLEPFFKWATEDKYANKIASLAASIFFFLSLPISYSTYSDLPFELPQLLLSASIGTCGVMIPFVARLRLGWGSVGDRLKQREVYYEVNQRAGFFNKDEETATRDRLLAETEVNPILRRIDKSLAVWSAALVLSFASSEVVTIMEGDAGPATQKMLSGQAAADYTQRLREDNDFAAAEQARARKKAKSSGSDEGVRPVYCDSTYLKILAGGNGQGGVGCQ